MTAAARYSACDLAFGSSPICETTSSSSLDAPESQQAQKQIRCLACFCAYLATATVQRGAAVGRATLIVGTASQNALVRYAVGHWPMPAAIELHQIQMIAATQRGNNHEPPMAGSGQGTLHQPDYARSSDQRRAFRA
jgi:hypothetical protein